MSRAGPAPRAPLGLPAYVLISFLALGLVWALASPYAATVDEEANLVKALGASTGDLTGKPATWQDVPLTPAQQRTVDPTTRQFRVPERLAPRGTTRPCFLLQPTQPASCLKKPAGRVFDRTYVGIYPPLPYVLPGLAARMANGPVAALFLARLAIGIVCLVLLALCLGGIRDSHAPTLSLLGPTVALSPGVLFFAWSVNMIGLEMMAGLCFLAMCLRLVRHTPPPPSLWIVSAVIGFVLGTSRPLAFVWIFYAMMVAAVVHGPVTVVRRLRQGGKPAAVMLAVLAAATLSTILWNFMAGTQTPGGVLSVAELVRPTLNQILYVWPVEQLGILRWGEVELPAQVYLAWKLLFLAMGSVALAVGTWRQRLAPILLFVTYLGFSVALIRTTQAGGFDLAPRYLQPAFMAFPLVWGEVILLNRHRLPPWVCRTLVLVSVTVVALTHGVALLFHGRRWSVGSTGKWSYLLDGGQWAPPGGWLPWTALAAVGVAVLIFGFVKASFKETRLGGIAPTKPLRPHVDGGFSVNESPPARAVSTP